MWPDCCAPLDGDVGLGHLHIDLRHHINSSHSLDSAGRVGLKPTTGTIGRRSSWIGGLVSGVWLACKVRQDARQQTLTRRDRQDENYMAPSVRHSHTDNY